MKDDMRWEQKPVDGKLRASEPGKGDYTSSGLFKAGLAVLAGLIVAALARGVKKSDDFEEYQKDIDEKEFEEGNE